MSVAQSVSAEWQDVVLFHEFERTRKEPVVAYFKVSRRSSKGSEEYNE
jgi:hypothetical protein